MQEQYEMQNEPLYTAEEAEPTESDLSPTEEAAVTKVEPTEAASAKSTAEPMPDSRAHLTSSVPKAAKAPLGSLTKQELNELRAIFGKLSDTEIQRLYKRVTKQN